MEAKVVEQITELQSLSAIWSIGASIASIVLAVVAIALAIYFYTQAKNSEKEVSTSLSKIEAQADALGAITGKQFDRLTKHVTEKRNSNNDPELKAILDMATTITEGIKNSHVQPANDRSPKIETDTIMFLVGTYYYSAVANYYAFLSLPEASRFDEENSFHKQTKSMMDLTANDFKFVKDKIDNISKEQIEKSGLINLYNEANDMWAERVRDSATAFVNIEQFKNET